MKHKYVRFFVLPIVSLFLFGCSTSEKKEDIFDGTEPPVVEHQHTFSDSWSYNAQTHWHAATCEHSQIRKDEAVHDFDVKETPATFEKEGQLVYTCKVCHFSRTEGIPKLTHEYSSDWEHDHYSHWHVCVDEGYENIRKDLADHVYVENITEPTFEEDGIKETTCSVCGYSYSVSIPKLTHSYSDSWDHDEHGHWHHCIDEGFTDDIVDYAVHNFKEETTNPTYEEAGRTTYTCKECGYSYYVEIDPIEHKFSDKFASDEEGHWHPCTDKGYETLKSGYEEHNFSSEVVAPTYTEEGYTIHTCEECGYKYVDEPVDKLEHHYGDKWVNDAWGHWHVCSDEGYDDLKVDYESHNYDSEITVEPTAFEDGVEKFTCEECGFSYTKKIPSYYTQCVNSCEYQLINNSYYRLSRVPENIKVVYVADVYNGLPVREIRYCLHSNVTELHLGKNVDSVYFYELYSYATNIEVVELNDNFTSFPFYFYNLTKLREVYLGNCSSVNFGELLQLPSLEKINIKNDNPYYSQVDGAIYSSDMSTLYFYPRDKEGAFVLPSTVTQITRYAFAHSKIPSIDLSTVRSIDDYAFYDCNELVSVILPSCYENCLAYCSFSSCSNLEEVTINTNPWSYSDEVFKECGNISKINISKNVTYIYTPWFRDSRISEVNVEEGNENYSVNGKFLTSWFFDVIYLCLDKESSNVAIPDSVTTLSTFAFSNCAITSVDLNNVTYIERGCFYNCFYLSEVDLSQNNNYSYDLTFYNCQFLQRVTFPANDQLSFYGQCFYNCISLEEVVGLERCCRVDRECFMNCEKMAHSYGNIGYIGNQDNPYLIALKPINDYNQESTIEFVSDCKIVGSYAFNSFYGIEIEEIKLNNIETVCESAFNGCGMRSVDFGTSLKYIGGYAFCNSRLVNVTLPETVTKIEYWSFSYCSFLSSIYIPKSVTYLSSEAFCYDFNLTNITIDEENQNYEVYKNAIYSVNDKILFWEFSYSDTLIVKEDTLSINWYFLEGREYNSTLVSNIYFEFSEERYYSSNFYEYNTHLLRYQNRYFYSETFAGNCWHYVEGVPTLW